MKVKRQIKSRRDKDGYEYGGSDLNKMRRIDGREREKLLKHIRKGPVKRFIDKVTA